MNDKLDQKQRIKSYLLRQMSADERAEFEQEYGADAELFDELVAVEDKMIGSYLRGEGTEQERKQFASHFLKTPAGKERVAFAQSWMDYVASDNVAKPGIEPADVVPRIPGRLTPRPKYWARLGIAAAWLIVVAGGAWMAMVNVQLRRQRAHMRDEQQELRHQEEELKNRLSDTVAKLQQEQRVETELQQQLAQLEAVNPVPAFVLSPHLARGGNNQKPLFIASGTFWARLQINLQYDDYPTYNVSLETPEGNQVWHRENLKSRMIQRGQPAITVNLPANGLQSRTYVLRVVGVAASGATSVGDYSFRTIKR